MRCTRFIPALATLAAAVTIGPKDTPEPWEVSSAWTFSPSGRPGSSPYSTVNVTITDPNTVLAGPAPRGSAIFVPTTTVCNASFTPSTLPYNKVYNCSEVQYGYWTFEMLEANNTQYASATTNFDVRFTHVDNVTVIGNVYTKVYIGTGHFQLGTNMAGVCGASGVCSWGLEETEKPYLIHQNMTACTGLC